MLEKKQIKQLRKNAHHLKPEFNIGKDGITPAFIKSLDQAFNTKELLKVKILDNCNQDMNEILASLKQIKDLELVQKIGRTLVLFRPDDLSD